MPGEPALRAATLDDLLHAMDEERRCEMIDGVLVEKASADESCGGPQSELVGRLRGPYNRRPGEEGPAAGGSAPRSTSAWEP